MQRILDIGQLHTTITPRLGYFLGAHNCDVDPQAIDSWDPVESWADSAEYGTSQGLETQRNTHGKEALWKTYCEECLKCIEAEYDELVTRLAALEEAEDGDI